MQELIYKVFDNFEVSWDPELLTKNYTEISNNSSVYYDPSGKAHWQNFNSTCVSFGRNFFKNHIDECMEVVEKLNLIKNSLKSSDNQLIELFRTHTINPGGISIIKTFPGKDIKLHKDVTRKYCLNIGLKNSNKWESFISTTESLDDFNNNEYVSYILEDGHGYLLNINNPHYAVCLDHTNMDEVRYVLTYTYYK